MEVINFSYQCWIFHISKWYDHTLHYLGQKASSWSWSHVHHWKFTWATPSHWGCCSTGLLVLCFYSSHSIVCSLQKLNISCLISNISESYLIQSDVYHSLLYASHCDIWFLLYSLYSNHSYSKSCLQDGADCWHVQPSFRLLLIQVFVPKIAPSTTSCLLTFPYFTIFSALEYRLPKHRV